MSLPVGVCLMFPFGAGLGVAGFWSAQLLAQTFLSLLLLIFQFCVINWDQEVDKARKRIHDNHVAKVEAADGRGGGGGGGRSDSGGDRSDKDGELCVGGDVGVHTGRVSGVNNGGLEEEGGG